MSKPDQSADGAAESSPASYLEPYRSAIDTFGPSFEATLWQNPKMQQIRFDVFLEMADFNGRVVVDAGSGQGGLADYLIEKGIKYRRYIGLDAMEAMIEQSRLRRLADADFHVSDFVGEEDSFSRYTQESGRPGLDLAVFSGSLNTLDQEFAIKVLERAWNASRVGVVFNFLSDRANADLLKQDTLPARRFSPIDMLGWAFSKTTSVRFRQDYLPGGHDATIALFKVE